MSDREKRKIARDLTQPIGLTAKHVKKRVKKLHTLGKQQDVAMTGGESI